MPELLLSVMQIQYGFSEILSTAGASSVVDKLLLALKWDTIIAMAA